MVAPFEPSKMNARQMSMPEATISAFRRKPAILPWNRHSAG